MMNQHTSLLVCTVLATLSSLATCDEKPIDNRYVDWSVVYKECKGEYKYCEPLEVTKSALQKIEGDDLEVICGNIDLLSNSAKDRGELQVYRDLIHFTTKDLGVRDVFLVLQITLFMRDEPDKWARFIPLLKRFGGDQFCKESKRGIELNFISRGAEQKLDQLFAALIGLKSKGLNDEILARATGSFDLTCKKLNVREALMVAKATVISSKIFIRYFLGLCQQFQTSNHNSFNILALADELGSCDREDSQQTLKWKEYNRLCLSLLRPDSKKIIKDNIKNALGE